MIRKFPFIKRMTVLFAFTAAISTYDDAGPSTGPGGWETGGGDLSALSYVKIARALADEMSQGRESCSALTKLVDPAKFNQAVESVRVSSVNGTPENVPGTIQFNRRSWYNSSKEEQLVEVFSGYSVLALSEHVRVEGSAVLQCLPAKTREKIFGHFNEFAVGSADVFLREFHQASRMLQKTISNHSGELKAWSIPTARLSEILAKAQNAHGLNEANGFSLQAASKAIRFKSGEMKDGKNSKNGDSLFLSLNESVWVRSTEAQRVELLFHECLGLADVDDSRYQYSSRLWKLVPTRFYVML